MQRPSAFHTRLQHPRVALLVAGLVTLLLLGVSVLMGLIAHHEAIQNERLKAIGDLGSIRAGLEGSLNSRLLLGKGLVSYIAVKPDLSAKEFADYAQRLVARDPMIRNITVVKGTTVLYAHPLQSNEKVIGVDLAKVPQQRDSLFKAIETQEAVVIPRVELIQGGVATISRIPVLLEHGGEKRYWGQVSIVLMQDVLFREARLFEVSFGLRCALQEKHGDGGERKHLFGDASIRSKSPVELDVIFPYGTWTLSALPEKGWGYSDTLSIRYGLFGAVLSLALGVLLFSVYRSRRRIDQLESILPICAGCKKIRNEEGSWNSVESYFSASSDIKFSHGLCPECLERFYEENPEVKRK